ncbi:MAG TPA: TPM domain-containing protein [Hyphomicrobium sp.]|nr:TPM domain-containing protein [Hyphomicrobium sp.]
MKAGVLALAILLIAPGCSAKADVPAGSREPSEIATSLPQRPEGPVLDEAHIIPDDAEAMLDKQLRDLWERNHTALVVVSVNSLGGDTIEHFSLQLANAWGIGDARDLRGLLVLVAPNERQVRIEVSCGLENVITDVFAGQVIRERMIPRFKHGNLSEGTLAGVDALIEKLDASANPPPVSASCRSKMKEAA